MKKRIISALLAFILTACFAFSLTSCAGEAPNLDGYRERFVYLIEESREMNVILFGVGLPVYRRDSELSDRKMVYYNTSLGNYDRVMENCGYISIEDIKFAIEDIYSSSYIEDVYEGAFDGIMTGEASAYVRFYDDGSYIYQHTNLYAFTVMERIYDYSTMEIVAPYTSDYINVKIESYTLEDSLRKEVYLSFVYENGNWYLDSPTY